GADRAGVPGVHRAVAHDVRHPVVLLARDRRLGTARPLRRACPRPGLRLARGRYPGAEPAPAAALSRDDRMSDTPCFACGDRSGTCQSLSMRFFRAERGKLHTIET